MLEKALWNIGQRGTKPLRAGLPFLFWLNFLWLLVNPQELEKMTFCEKYIYFMFGGAKTHFLLKRFLVRCWVGTNKSICQYVNKYYLSYGNDLGQQM